MKKLFLLLLICFPIISGARERGLEAAREIAYGFLESKVLTKSSNVSLDMVYSGAGSPKTRSGEGAPSFYVFDNEIGPGFVIVSGDDAVQQILAYSYDSNFRADNIPSNLLWWLDTMNSQVENLRETGDVASDAGVIPGVATVYYETAKWDQSSPFSDQCPAVMTNGKLQYTLTGCGPTAIAIVLRSRQYPHAGIGTTPEYVTYLEKLTVAPRELGEEYQWEEMPLYSPYKKAWTDTQKEQVARLIADIGAAAQVEYGFDGTSISSYDVAPAMKEFFRYDKSAYLADRDYYTDKDWLPLIKKELLNNGPVIYSGSSNSGCHMFVLDGYDSNDYFHVNWGWSGSSDGYYSLSAMNPGKPEAGPGSVAHSNGYNRYHDAIINLIPDQGGEEYMLITFYNVENNDGTFKGLTVNEYDQTTGLPSSVNVGAIRNRGNETCHDLKVRLAVVDRDMNLKKVMWEETIDELRYSYHVSYPNVSLTDYGTIDFGYLLIAQYYDINENEWKKIRADRTLRGVESISLAEQYSIEESTVFRYENSTRTITLKTKDNVEVRCFKDGVDYTVEDKGDNTFVIDTAPLQAGVYTIGLSKGIEYHELRVVVGTNKD